MNKHEKGNNRIQLFLPTYAEKLDTTDSPFSFKKIFSLITREYICHDP